MLEVLEDVPKHKHIEKDSKLRETLHLSTSASLLSTVLLSFHKSAGVVIRFKVCVETEICMRIKTGFTVFIYIRALAVTLYHARCLSLSFHTHKSHK